MTTSLTAQVLCKSLLSLAHNTTTNPATNLPLRRYRQQKSSKSRLATRSPSPPAAAGVVSSLSPKKLEDLLPQALNRLTPSNIKRTASDFMKEWERSLLASPVDDTFPQAAGGEVGKPNGA